MESINVQGKVIFVNGMLCDWMSGHTSKSFVPAVLNLLIMNPDVQFTHAAKAGLISCALLYVTGAGEASF